MNQNKLVLCALATALAFPSVASAQYRDHRSRPDRGPHQARGHILQIPYGTRVVDASGMQHVTEVGHVPRTVEVLNLRGTNVTRLPNLPHTLRTLDVSRTRIRRLPWLPAGLTTLRARGGELTRIRYLPNELRTLDVAGSRLAELPNLPQRLSVLDVSRTPMTRLPPLPHGLVELRARHTAIRVAHVPPSVRVFEAQTARPPVVRPTPARRVWSREWQHRRTRERTRVRVRGGGPTYAWDSGWERARRRRAR